MRTIAPGAAFADCRSERKIPELDGGALRMWVGVYCVRRAPFLDGRPGSRYCRHRTLPERNTLRIFADAAELCLTPAWGLGSALWEISEMKIGMRCILAALVMLPGCAETRNDYQADDVPAQIAAPPQRVNAVSNALGDRLDGMQTNQHSGANGIEH